MSDQCQANSRTSDLLTLGLILGTIASYIPQHVRIIVSKSSEGFSPWYLLLGCVAGAGAMLNIIVMQWDVLLCCRRVNTGTCLGLIGGVLQTGVVWACFGLILVLYMLYFPSHLKFISLTVDPDTEEAEEEEAPFYGATSHSSRGEGHRARRLHVKTAVRTEAWRTSVLLAWVVGLHLVFCTFVTFLLLATSPSSGHKYATPRARELWATFLGISSTSATMIQYMPQLRHTYTTKLVGALSIPMMLVQTPGAALVVASIAIRPGTNWTSWITFAAAGVMQGALLLLCLFYKARQAKLGIDDFGAPLHGSTDSTTPHSAPDPAPTAASQAPKVPEPPQAGVPVTAGPSTPGVGVPDALHAALAKDVRAPATPGVTASLSHSTAAALSSEQTSLLPATPTSKDNAASKKRWWSSVTGR